MTEITIEEISQNLLSYLHRAQAGECFIILESGTPIVQLQPTQSPAQSRQKPTVASAIATFRSQLIAESIDIDPDEVWGDVRDRTPVSNQPHW